MRPAGMALIALLCACTGTITDRLGGGDDGDDDDDFVPAADANPADPDSAPGADPDAGPDFTMLSPQEQELFEIINAERAAMGLGTVELRADLNCAAARHSQDVGSTQTCSHTGNDGSSPGSRVSDCGGPGWTGEILACGQGTPRSAVDAWIGSPGHNAIMFTPGQRTIGVAMHNNFWTAIFDQ